MNEDWSTRYISLNRGHWEEVVPVIAKAQDAHTASIVETETLKKVGGWLYKKVSPNTQEAIVNLIELNTLLQGKWPEEG